MKRLFVSMCVMLICLCASAQMGSAALGVKGSYASEIENVGVGVLGQYFFTDALRGEASFDYFFKKNGLSMWDINANLHYLFDVADNVFVYPLAGVGYTNWKASAGGVSNTEGKIAVNLGGGIQFNISDAAFISAEGKYQIIEHFNQFVVGVGLGFRF